MNTDSFSIAYPASKSAKAAWNKAYGMNAYYSGKHWSQRKQDAEFWHWQTVAAMRKAKCRTVPFDKPVIITFLWNDSMDLDNHSVIAKMIVDGMKGTIITDDTRKYIQGIEHYFHDDDSIQITIREI